MLAQTSRVELEKIRAELREGVAKGMDKQNLAITALRRILSVLIVEAGGPG